MMRITGMAGTARGMQTGTGFQSPLMQTQKKAKQGTTMNDLLGGNTHAPRTAKSAKAKKTGVGFSQAGMQAMLSAASSMKQARTQGSAITGLEGRAGVLEIEIRQDAGRGASVEKKKEELAEVEQNAAEAGAAQMSSLGAVNQAVKEAAAAEAEAAAEETAAAKKAEKNDKSQSREASNESGGEAVSSASDSPKEQGLADVSTAAHTAASTTTASPLPESYTPVDIRL